MITMEFDELQKIWDAQNNTPLYAIDEKAMHNHIQSKMRQGYHITNISELLLIVVNLGTGGFILTVNLLKQHGYVSMYLMAAWMFATALYSLVSRIRRINATHRFDRSMLGDLQHAISVATYQVRLSRIMRWNMLPVAALVSFSLWESGKSFWITGAALLFFAITWYATRWEHSIYRNRKRDLEILQQKLETAN